MKYLLLFIFSSISLGILCQNSTSENILFYKKISDLLQSGIKNALQDKLTESYAPFDQAYELCVTNKCDPLIPVIVLAQSRLYLLEDKYNEAFQCVQKADSLIKTNSHNSLAGDYYEFMGQYFLHEKKYEIALDDFKISEKIRSEIEPGKNWRTYNGMTRIYKILNQTENFEKYNALASKLSKIQNSRRIILDMQSDLRFDEQSGTIAYLNQENLKSKVELQKVKFRNILLLLGLISSVMVSTMLIVILRQRSKYNKEIAIKNEIISKSLAEKELLMKEIHHRVKNNLQVISSLLSLQSRSIDDKNASEALLQSQSRVISMSLIHETLYKDGSSSSLDLDEYLTSLCQQIFNTYNISGDGIQLHTNIQKLRIDVVNLVPLGLIVNEIITNALKHAFTGRVKGNVWVATQTKVDSFIILIRDDGIGENSTNRDKGFGNKLIETFSKRINATIEQNYENGTEIKIKINYFNPSDAG